MVLVLHIKLKSKLRNDKPNGFRDKANFYETSKKVQKT